MACERAGAVAGRAAVAAASAAASGLVEPVSEPGTTGGGGSGLWARRKPRPATLKPTGCVTTPEERCALAATATSLPLRRSLAREKVTLLPGAETMPLGTTQ